MKALITHWKVIVLSGLLSVNSVKSLSQPPPDFSFTSPVLLSGTLNAVGSVYRFSSIKPGVDAVVTITAAVNASVAIMDQTAGAGGGYDAAFQPNITVTKLTTGYIDFNINFVVAGTFTLMPQTSINVTALDIDGYNYSSSLQLYEFEQFDMGSSSTVNYYFGGTDLSFSYVGTAIRATNVGGNEYGAINTSQNVRYTMYTPNVSNLKVRSGAINNDQFNNVTRQRSFYFARFNYSNVGVLAAADLQNFSGITKNNAVQLNWKLVQGHNLSRVEIERSGNNQVYEKIAEINAFAANDFNFIDNTAAKGNNYYRLRLYDSNGSHSYSNILKVATENSNFPVFSVFPTVISGQASMLVKSNHPSRELLTVADAGGRLLIQKWIDIPEGATVKSLPELVGLEPGNYIITLNLAKQKLTQRIIIARN